MGIFQSEAEQFIIIRFIDRKNDNYAIKMWCGSKKYASELLHFFVKFEAQVPSNQVAYKNGVVV